MPLLTELVSGRTAPPINMALLAELTGAQASKAAQYRVR